MSCIHNVWNCYCKVKQDVIEKPCSPLCKDYCCEETSVIKQLNKGSAVAVTCNFSDSTKLYPFMTVWKDGVCVSTAENDYVSLIELFINTLYINEDHSWGFFGYDATRAEERVEEDMFYLGFTEDEVRDAYTIVCAKHMHIPNACKIRLHQFISRMLDKKKKKEHAYPFEFRFVLALILGCLDKLDSIAIIDCDDPKSYFKDKVSEVLVPNLTDAVNKTRLYVKASKDNNLAEGMRMVEQWFEDIAKENIPPKELTIADIEKQLGYKIKIVGDKK